MRSRISTWIPAFIAFAISSKNVKNQWDDGSSIYFFLWYTTVGETFSIRNKNEKKELKNDSNRTKLALLKYFKYMKHYLFIEIFDSENYLCYNFKDSMPKYSLYLTRLSSFLASLYLLMLFCLQWQNIFILLHSLWKEH